MNVWDDMPAVAFATGCDVLEVSRTQWFPHNSAGEDFRVVQLTPPATTPQVFVDDLLTSWFEDTDHIDHIDDVRTRPHPGRFHLTYRAHVTNDDGAFLVEQQAYSPRECAFTVTYGGERTLAEGQKVTVTRAEQLVGVADSHARYV